MMVAQRVPSHNLSKRREGVPKKTDRDNTSGRTGDTKEISQKHGPQQIGVEWTSHHHSPAASHCRKHDSGNDKTAEQAPTRPKRPAPTSPKKQQNQARNMAQYSSRKSRRQLPGLSREYALPAQEQTKTQGKSLSSKLYQQQTEMQNPCTQTY